MSLRASDRLRVKVVDVELDVDDAATRITHCGHEVVQRLYFVIRDSKWRSLTNDVKRQRSTLDSNGFLYEAEGDAHDANGPAVSFRTSLSATADGRIRFETEACALRDIECQRVGACVHLGSRELSGASWSVPGDGRSGIFPPLVAPQLIEDGVEIPMIDRFGRIEVDHPASGTSELSFKPDGYMLEDQRNWCDASFKAYGPSNRFVMRQGAVVESSVEVNTPRVAKRARDRSAVPNLEIGNGVQVPAIGSDGNGEFMPTPLPRHLRRSIDEVDELDCESGCAVELVIRAGDDLTRVAATDVTVDRVILIRGDERTPSPEEIAWARGAVGDLLPGVPLFVGTSSYFSEINRRRPNLTSDEGVSWMAVPQVHSRDEASIMANLGALADIAGTCRKATGCEAIAISALDLSPTKDERGGGAFAAAWLAGAIIECASSGISSLTLGPNTFGAEPPGSNPVTAVVDAISGMADKTVSAVYTGDRKVIGITSAPERPAGLVLVNLDCSPAAVRLPSELRSRALIPTSAEKAQRTLASDGSLVLGGYEVACLASPEASGPASQAR